MYFGQSEETLVLLKLVARHLGSVIDHCFAAVIFASFCCCHVAYVHTLDDESLATTGFRAP